MSCVELFEIMPMLLLCNLLSKLAAVLGQKLGPRRCRSTDCKFVVSERRKAFLLRLTSCISA
jgi:hypothetical protein